MKQYVITPRDWNESKHDYIADYNAEETATTYADAIRIAKHQSTRYSRVDVEFYELKRRECTDDVDYLTEWEYNRANHHKWIESFKDGKQYPCVFVSGEPIWRWDGCTFHDLKPRVR